MPCFARLLGSLFSIMDHVMDVILLKSIPENLKATTDDPFVKVIKQLFSYNVVLDSHRKRIQTSYY